MTPQEALFKYFGYKSFRPNQVEIIEEIINGKNVVAVLPTGAGKSICYQIPALITKNFSIVVSPLISLMKDQVDALNRNGEIAAFINSTMNFTEADTVIQNISYGKYKLLYVAPERLENIIFAEKIKSLSPSYIFIDEAHCISEWGHNFRPSYRKIKDFVNYIGLKKISAFTATATPEVVKDIVEQLGFRNPHLVVKGFERDNLYLNVIITKRKNEKCIELISRYKTPAIIYTASRKKTEEVAEFLNLHKINCAFYHAGMAPEERKKIQDDFLNDKISVIAATNAFGMGIDKKDIRLVIHYNTPGSIENYYQEIGRAGRDGNISYAFLLHDDSDINIQNFFLTNSHPDKQLIQNIYDAICDYGRIAEGNISPKEIPLNRDYINSYCKREVNRGLLYATINILETGGYLRLLSEFESKVTVQIMTGKNKLKDFITGVSNNLIKEILLYLLREFGGEVFLKKTIISINKVAKALGFSETEVEETLTTLDNLGIIIFTNLTSKDNVLLTAPRISSTRLNLDYLKINKNFINQQKKIEQMVSYVYSDQCRFKYILNYFGEDTNGYLCNRCDNCVELEKLPLEVSDYLKEVILRTIYYLTEPASENFLISIIKGSKNTDKFSWLDTYASCKNYTKEELKIALEKLIIDNLIEKDNSKNKSLKLSSSGIDYLTKNNIINKQKIEQDNYESNIEIYNRLKEVRTRASKRFMQTGYLICPDEVLRELSFKKPKTKNAMLSIKGFNNRMFNKLGNELLEVILEYEKEKNKSYEMEKQKRDLPQNIKETFNLLKAGYSLKDISSLRKLSEAVISMQIETIIEYYPNIEIEHLFNKNSLRKIYDILQKGTLSLKELKSSLNEDIEFPLLRIALAKFKSNFS
jgi:ATP-dependent DNA helicase RecQ